MATKHGYYTYLYQKHGENSVAFVKAAMECDEKPSEEQAYHIWEGLKAAPQAPLPQPDARPRPPGPRPAGANHFPAMRFAAPRPFGGAQQPRASASRGGGRGGAPSRSVAAVAKVPVTVVFDCQPAFNVMAELKDSVVPKASDGKPAVNTKVQKKPAGRIHYPDMSVEMPRAHITMTNATCEGALMAAGDALGIECDIKLVNGQRALVLTGMRQSLERVFANQCRKADFTTTEGFFQKIFGLHDVAWMKEPSFFEHGIITLTGSLMKNLDSSVNSYPRHKPGDLKLEQVDEYDRLNLITSEMVSKVNSGTHGVLLCLNVWPQTWLFWIREELGGRICQNYMPGGPGHIIVRDIDDETIFSGPERARSMFDAIASGEVYVKPVLRTDSKDRKSTFDDDDDSSDSWSGITLEEEKQRAARGKKPCRSAPERERSAESPRGGLDDREEPVPRVDRALFQSPGAIIGGPEPSVRDGAGKPKPELPDAEEAASMRAAKLKRAREQKAAELEAVIELEAENQKRVEELAALRAKKQRDYVDDDRAKKQQEPGILWTRELNEAVVIEIEEDDGDVVLDTGEVITAEIFDERTAFWMARKFPLEKLDAELRLYVMSNTITDERGLLKDDTKTAAENPILKGFRLTDGEICRIMHHKSEWEKKNWKEGMEDEEKQEIAEAAAKELGMTVTPSRGKFREWNVQYGPDGYSMVRARLFEHKLLIAFKILDARKLSIKTPCTKPYKAPDAPERSADDALDFLADRVDAGTGTDEKRDSPATKKPKKKEDTVPEMLDYCHSQSREGMRPAYDAAMGDVHAETPSKSEHNGDDDDETTPHGSTPLKASKA